MSTLLNPKAVTTYEKMQTPFSHYLSWSSEGGELFESKKDSEFKPIKKANFIVLDILNKVQQRDNQRPLSDQISTQLFDDYKKPIKFFGKNEEGKYSIVYEGAYSDKDTKTFCLLHGLKNTLQLVVSMKVGEKMEICLIQFAGDAYGEWINFQKENRDFNANPAVQLSGSFEKQGRKKRDGTYETYNLPIFKTAKAKPETIAEVMESTEYLVKYLNEKVAGRKEALKESKAEESRPEVPEGFESHATQDSDVLI
jgi:hypothetical protein